MAILDLSGLDPARQRASQTLEGAYADDEDAYIKRIQRTLYGDLNEPGVLPNLVKSGLTLAQPEGPYQAGEAAAKVWENTQAERQSRQINAINAYLNTMMTEPKFRLEEAPVTGYYGPEKTPTLAREQTDIEKAIREGSLLGYYGPEKTPTLASQKLSLQAELGRGELSLRERQLLQNEDQFTRQLAQQFKMQENELTAQRDNLATQIAAQERMQGRSITSAEAIAAANRQLQRELTEREVTSREILTREQYQLQRDMLAQQLQQNAALQGQRLDWQAAQSEADRLLRSTLTREEIASREGMTENALDWLKTQAIAQGAGSVLDWLLNPRTGLGGAAGGILGATGLGSIYQLLTGKAFPGIIPTVTSWFTPSGTLTPEAQAALDAIWAEDATFGQALQETLTQAAPGAAGAGALSALAPGAAEAITAAGYTPEIIAAELANMNLPAASAAPGIATETVAPVGGPATWAPSAVEGMSTLAPGAAEALAAAGYTPEIIAAELANMALPTATAAGTTAATAAGAMAATPTMMVGPAAAGAAGAGMVGASTAATATLPYVAPELLAGMGEATGAFAAGAPFAATPLVIIAAIAALTMTLNPQIPRERREIERYERALGHLQEFGGSQESLAQHIREANAYGQSTGSLEYLNAEPAAQSYAFLEYLASGGLNPAGIDVMAALGWQAGAYPDVNQMVADAGQWIMVSLPDQGGDVLMLRSDLEEIQRLGSQSEQGSQ